MAYPQSDHYGIVIGLSAYPSLGDPPGTNLQGPENDAELIYNWLTAQDGAGLPADNVKMVLSRNYTAPPNSRPFSEELDDDVFRWVNGKKAGNTPKIGRRLYFYASGHGFSPTFGHGCLLAGSATETALRANVSPSIWLNWWRDAGYFREFVLWMDCCMDRGGYIAPQPPPDLAVNVVAPPSYSFVAFAASRPLKAVEKPIIEDGGKVHGVFTWNLLRGLRGAAANSFGMVTGASLADWLRHSQLCWLEGPDLTNPEIAKEPAIVDDDSGLVFKRGISPVVFKVELVFPNKMDVTTARIWSGAVPSPGPSLVVAGNRLMVDLPAGLHLVEAPGTAIRHGFAVTRGSMIEVQDTGARPSQTTGFFELTAQNGDATAEIRLLGDRFETLDADVGRLAASLPYGLYAMRFKVGRQTNEKVILLDADWPPLPGGDESSAQSAPVVPPITSGAPLPMSAATHERQREAVVTSQSRVDVQAGVGAELLVMPRVWSPSRDAAGPLPWTNVAVLNSSGQMIADLSVDGIRGVEPDPFAVCSIALAPGSYVLRHKGEHGAMIAKSLIVPPNGWRLEAYLLHRPGFSDSVAVPRVTFLMRRINAPWGTDEDTVLEKLKVALADERPILNQNLSMLLLQKFQSPLAGIIGAHLLLIGAERGASGPGLELLNEVVWNLRGLVGTEHPDVEALSLKCPNEALRRATPVTTPPMFDRSWRMLVDGCRDTPDLIPLSLWQQVHTRVGGQSPFFTWALDDTTQSNYREKLAEVVFTPLNNRELASGAPAQAVQPVGALMPSQPLAAMSMLPSVTADPLISHRAQQCAASLGVPPSALSVLHQEYQKLKEKKSG